MPLATALAHYDAQNSNSLMNLIQFVLKYRSTSLQSFDDVVQDRPLLNFAQRSNEELQPKLSDTEKQLSVANNIIELIGEADRLAVSVLYDYKCKICTLGKCVRKKL